MCRSLAEGGRRCPHQGYSSGRANQAARQQLNRALHRLSAAEATGDSARITKVQAQVTAARARVEASKHPDTAHPEPPTTTPQPPQPATKQDHPSGLQPRILEAYEELSVKPQDWVRLAKLREKLGNPDPAEMWQTLRPMTMTGLVHLAPCSNRKAHTAADRAAAIRIGDQDKHLLAIEPEYFDTLTQKPDQGST